MADFGKLNFSVSFNPTSAFPLDARCYFTDYASDEAAAATAEEAGSTNTVYYYGMRLLVDDGETVTWYTIQRDNTLKQDKVEGKGIVSVTTNEYDFGRIVSFQYTDGTSDHVRINDGGSIYLYNRNSPNFSIPNTYPSQLGQLVSSAVTLTGGSKLSKRDLLLSNDGSIYRVTYISSDGQFFAAEYALSIKGSDGDDGKSAYQYAVDGGYEGTEEEFATKLAELMNSTSTPGDDSGGDDGEGDDSGGDDGEGDDVTIILPPVTDDPAMGQVPLRKYVLATEQTLTDEEKAQARSNIGALSESDISETLLQRLIAQQFSKFIVIGQDEPEYGPCLWFDTNITVPIYLVLDDFTDGTVASAEVDNILYDVLNTDNPSFADDGTVVLTISE